MNAADVLALLRRYDDDALAALASRGLLRRARKDLESGAPPVVREDGNEVVVETGGQVVRFGAAGAVGARCSCPATSVCQHVLAGVLAAAAWPVSEASANIPDDGSEPRSGTGASANIPGDELAAITSAELRAHAGTPGYRWAWQLVEDLEAAEGVRVEAGTGVVVRFVRPALTFRYVGGPLAGMVVDPPPKQVERYRVAAVLAYQRARGLEPDPPPAPRTRQTPGQDALDLGRELAADGTLGDQRELARRRLRAAVTALTTECVVLGLAHLSPAVRERFTALAVSARAAEYHRLALALRRLADHVDLLLERHAAADSERLLDELAVTAALVGALDAAAARGTAPAHLVGRARGTFDAAGTLDLVGLGGRPWRSASGYVGLTMLFLAPATGTFLSWSEARPAALGGFDPVARHRAGGPWSGLVSPAATTGRRVVLVGAKVSETGRLSGAESTSATVAPAGDLTTLLHAEASWPALHDRFAARRRGLLAAPDPLADWVVLAPAATGEAGFDEAAQTLRWPLIDDAGERLEVRVRFDDLTAPAVRRLEVLAAGDTTGLHVVARLVRTPEGLAADPLSLVHPVPGPDGLRVEALAFPTASAAPPAASVAPPGPVDGADDVPEDDADDLPPPPAAVPAPVRDLRAWLRVTAERGASPASLPAQTAELSRLAQRASSAGLTTFGPLARPVTGVPDLAGRLLRAHALVLAHERVAGP